MKLTIKLGAEESEGFKAFMATTKPDTISQDEYLRSLFFHGIERLKEQIEEVAREQLGSLNPEDYHKPVEEVTTHDVEKI